MFELSKRKIRVPMGLSVGRYKKGSFVFELFFQLQEGFFEILNVFTILVDPLSDQHANQR